MTGKGCVYRQVIYWGHYCNPSTPVPKSALWEYRACKGEKNHLTWEGLDSFVMEEISWAKLFFLWDCKNESDNLLKSFKHRLSSGPRKSEIILWIHVLILDPLKMSIMHLKNFFIGACILPESSEAWLGLGALEELAVITRQGKRWIVNAKVERLCSSAEGFYCTHLPETTEGFYIVECDLPSFGKITLSLA